MDDFVRKDKKFCPQILPHIVLSVGNVIYCKQLNDPASMKTKNRNTLMSTEHFSIHQGIFCTYRIKCKWQKINLCQSFFSDVQWFAEALRCFLLCYKNSFLPYFPPLCTAWKHSPDFLSLIRDEWKIVTENFHQFGFIDIQYKNFSDIVFEDHRSEVSADAEMKIGRKMI